MVQKHINRLRAVDMFQSSPIVIMVERNLGFEVRLSADVLTDL